MNFWTFEEDHSQGYFDTVPPKKSKEKGVVELLIASLASVIVQLFKLAGTILAGIFSLLCSLIGMAIKSVQK